MPGPLNFPRQGPLVLGANPAPVPANDSGPLRNVAGQHCHILKRGLFVFLAEDAVFGHFNDSFFDRTHMRSVKTEYPQLLRQQLAGLVEPVLQQRGLQTQVFHLDA